MAAGAQCLYQVNKIRTCNQQVVDDACAMQGLFCFLHQVDAATLQKRNLFLIQQSRAMQTGDKVENLCIVIRCIFAIRRQYMRAAVMCVYDAAMQIINRHHVTSGPNPSSPHGRHSQTGFRQEPLPSQLSPHESVIDPFMKIKRDFLPPVTAHQLAASLPPIGQNGRPSGLSCARQGRSCGWGAVRPGGRWQQGHCGFRPRPPFAGSA